MDYSPSQRRLLKSRFYRWVLNSSLGKRLDWKRAASYLEVILGVKIPHETLRQNIQPVSRKSGKPRREFTDPKRFEALYDFLIHEDIGYLTTREFENTLPKPASVAITLDEFLNSAPKTEFYDVMLSSITGRFVGEVMQKSDIEIMTLDIDYISPDHLIEVSFQFENEALDIDDNPVDILTYTGWMIANNDGFVQLFVSDQNGQDHRSYSLIQTAPALGKGEECKAIALFEYSGAIGGEIKQHRVESGIDQLKIGYSSTDVNTFCMILSREEIS